MAGIAKGIRVYRREGERTWRCDFSWRGRQYKLSTGVEQGRPEAEAVAAARAIEAAVIAGTWQGGRGASRKMGAAEEGEGSLAAAALRWLEGRAGTTLAHSTVASYSLYFVLASGEPGPLVAAFPVPSAITIQATLAFYSAQLQLVSRSTVSKMRGALVGVLRDELGWRPGKIAERVAELPGRAVGASAAKGRRAATYVTAEEMAAVIRELPVRDARGRICRARYAFMYATSLRPSTVARLEMPGHWKPGQQWLNLTARTNKGRVTRRKWLPTAALAALEEARCGRTSGLIFGPGSNRKAIASACKRLGIRGNGALGGIVAYDMRRNRITHYLEAGGDLAAAQGLADHASVQTTARYVLATQAAERRAAAAADVGAATAEQLGLTTGAVETRGR